MFSKENGASLDLTRILTMHRKWPKVLKLKVSKLSINRTISLVIWVDPDVKSLKFLSMHSFMKLTLYNKKGQTVHSKLLWFTMKFSLQTHVVRVQLPSDGVWKMNGLQELWVYGSITPLMELKSEPTVWRRQNCGHWDLVGRTASLVEFLKDGRILPLSMLPFLCCLSAAWLSSFVLLCLSSRMSLPCPGPESNSFTLLQTGNLWNPDLDQHA